MAMLAEKKRRTKWCLNPMGNDWAKDENKFGQKMLEKMGWSPGTGLGVRGQGPTDIIKINIKNDNLGLGSKHESQKEIWTKTLVNYDSLLAELNGVSKTEEREPEVLQSLEEKSRSSRSRVHYHKFTRGKDVSKYSSKDLSCILPLHKVKEEEEPSTTEKNNMYAYFGKKEKNPYKNLDYHETSIEIQDEVIDVNEVDKHQDFSSKSKKTKKSKVLDLEESDANIEQKKRKKKKKHTYSEVNVLKSSESNSNEFENNGEEENLDLNLECIDNIPKKKKKKKHLKQDKDKEC